MTSRPDAACRAAFCLHQTDVLVNVTDWLASSTMLNGARWFVAATPVPYVVSRHGQGRFVHAEWPILTSHFRPPPRPSRRPAACGRLRYRLIHDCAGKRLLICGSRSVLGRFFFRQVAGGDADVARPCPHISMRSFVHFTVTRNRIP